MKEDFTEDPLHRAEEREHHPDGLIASDARDGFPHLDLFDPAELQLMGDGSAFRVRARVIARIRLAFEAIRHRMARHVAQGHYLEPVGTDRRHGKIGRGEYLEEMPYVYVDLPRYFDGESCFTFRTLFWWGHGVSFSLILGGSHLTEYRQRLLQHLPVLKALQVHVSATETPWDWQRGPGHTLPLNESDEVALLRLWKGQNYLKCSRYLAFDEAEFRQLRIDEAAVLTFQAFEPLILA